MHMSFWWGSNLPNFLFPGFNITSAGGLVSTCFGLAALAIVFEWLKLLQARYRQRELSLRAQQIRTICPPSESATLLVDSQHRAQAIQITLCDRVTLCIWDGAVWFNLQILGYLLMLVVMGYNGWMTIALIVGSALGYFIFGPSFMKINLQNCQTLRDTFCAIDCAELEHDSEAPPTLVASTSAASLSQAPSQVAACVHVHAPPSGQSV